MPNLRIEDPGSKPIELLGIAKRFSDAEPRVLYWSTLKLPVLQLGVSTFIAAERPKPEWLTVARMERIEIHDGSDAATLRYMGARYKDGTL